MKTPLCFLLALAAVGAEARFVDARIETRALLANAIVHVPADRVGATRACHLLAAYWRAKRLGIAFEVDGK